MNGRFAIFLVSLVAGYFFIHFLLQHKENPTPTESAPELVAAIPQESVENPIAKISPRTKAAVVSAIHAVEPSPSPKVEHAKETPEEARGVLENRKEIFSVVKTTPELWAEELSKTPEPLRKAIAARGMPPTMMTTPDDETKVSSSALVLKKPCDALTQARNPITVSINTNGNVQDVLPSNSSDPTPDGIYECQFQPYQQNGVAISVVTTLFPPSSEAAPANQQ